MDKYISRDDVRRFIAEAFSENRFATNYDYAILFDKIGELPVTDVQPVNQWISVKDRLPDKSCECLGIVDGEVTEVSYSPKCKELICVWSMCDADGFKPLSDDAVTHWMPLPDPPQD